MSWWNPFSRIGQPRPAFSIVEYGATSIAIDSIDFFGQFARSTNEQFLFAWQDSDYVGGQIGGHRSRGMGRVILISGGQPMWQRDLQRPNDGAVANSGHCVVNDWLFGSGLSGKFYLLSPSGEILIEARFSANLVKCGIAEDGKLAWCSTARSDNKRDSEIICVFTTDPPRQMFKTDSLYGDVASLTASPDDIHIITEHGVTYRFSPLGKLLNADAVEAAIDSVLIDVGSCWELLEMVESQLKNFRGKENADEVFELLKLATERDPDRTMAARIERLSGELNYALGNKETALTHFKTALEIDPKVGVKRIVSRLEKETGKSVLE